MKSLLILVRTEGDFERAIALGIAAKNDFELTFVFVGDFSPFYNDGIKNIFQKKLFKKYGFEILDFSEFDLVGKYTRKLLRAKKVTLDNVRKKEASIFKFFLFKIFERSVYNNKENIIKKLIKEISPTYLFTDQSKTEPNYLPEEIRQVALKVNIPVYIFTHGSSGGLHSEFSKPIFNPYNGYTVCACNTNETQSEFSNRIITGDFASSYPYVHFINGLEIEDISFLDDKKYKVGIFVGGTGPLTSTTGALRLQEIIIDLSENEDVAMVLKLHPRDVFPDLRMLKEFKNLLIVAGETDRSRVTKWADILICTDASSVVFEPMILGKKVVAVEGKHVPSFKNHHSPLINSSATFISNPIEFDLEILSEADPLDDVTDKIAWGSNGKQDLAKIFLNKL